jgi:hypothetical protein
MGKKETGGEMTEKCCYDDCKFMLYGKDPSSRGFKRKFYVCIADGLYGVLIWEEQLEFIKQTGCKLYCVKGK